MTVPADRTAAFFEELRERRHEPLLEKATGTVRFDLQRGKRTETWFVGVTKGDLVVSREAAAADPDLTIRAGKALFDGVATGEVNPVAAVLRGAMIVEGDVRLVVLLQRLFPGRPPKGKKPRAAAQAAKQR
jgi:putative sterol carrier protein